MKKAFKVTLFLLGSIFILLLLAMLITPPVAKNYVEQHDKTLLGRELNIGSVGINVFTGKLKVKELTLFEEDDTTPFVQLDCLEAKIRLRELFEHRVWVKQAKITGLRLNVEQNRDWFNFTSFLAHFNLAKAETAEKYVWVFNDVHIDKGTLRYADLAVGSEFLIRDLSLRIPSIDLLDLKTDVGLDLCLSDETSLHTDLHLSDNAKKYFINFKLNKLSIEVIEPYLQQHCPVDLMSGCIDMNVEAQGQTDHILDFEMKGDLTLSRLSFLDTQGDPLGKIDSIYAEIKRFSINDRELTLDQLHLFGLNATYIVKADSTTNYDLFLGSLRHYDTTTMVAEETRPWNVSIADLKLSESQLRYEDYTLPKAFYYEISDISLSSKRFTLYGNNNIQLQAALNKAGRLNLNWQGRFLEQDNHNLTLMLTNVKVADFSPYAVQWFGFPIEDGTLSFRSQNVITDGELYGINKVQIASPKIGKKAKPFHPRFAKVPLKLGFYLLADKNNNVNLDLPVSGNLNDPSFSYRKTLGKAFSNLLTKATSSPFHRMMTDEDNNLKYIPFDPLQSDFTPEEYVMIDNLAVILQSRSDLGVVLEAQVQYEEVVKQLCVIQLQRDYYLSTHPGVKEDNIDFMTDEAIHSIKLNDKGLCDFAKQYSEKKRLRSAKDVVSVACAVYQEKSEKMLPAMLAKRNEILSDYLLKVKDLSPEQVSVTTIDESLMKSFVKTSRYEMHVFIYEEME